MLANKILIVEDDFLNAQLFKTLLENKGYDIIGIVETSNEAINMAQTKNPDLIILDIGLKGETNGIDTAKKIREYDIPFIFVTGNNDSETYKRAKETKPAGYILKPAKPEDFLNTVEIALNKNGSKIEKDIYVKELHKKTIIEETGERAYRFFEPFLYEENKKNLVVSTTTMFNIINQPESNFDTIINLKKTNNIKRINKFFEEINAKLSTNGFFIGYAETKGLKKKQILSRNPFILNYIIYFFYFIFKRVWPKLPYLKRLYFFITKGRNRSMSRAEVLGRLYSCGFEVLREEFIDANLYFVARRIKAPFYDMNASYDLIFKMKRIGKNGKTIFVYKFRTMHPYAEYLQDYILKNNGYSEIGKPAKDFRLTSWGRFMRKYWLDELPQLINVLKGEMKLVGIRPLSKRFLEEYPEDMLKMRLKHKPGCVPPYVALLKQDVKQYIESERIYLLEKEKNPYTTDIKYFFKAFYNIFTNKIRSS